MSEIKKVVLAYSGGLDTSIIIPWLKEHYDNCEVIAVCGNVGQKGELEGLETLTLDKLTAHKKRELAITFGELVYDGQWFSPLRKALSAFVTSTQEHVTGKVRLELYKGNLINAGVWSPYSLYREDIATFAAGGDYKQSDATGFISIYGLPTKVQAIVNNEKEGK